MLFISFRTGFPFDNIPDECYASDDPLEEYTVEKIIHKRIFNDKVQYFIKWKGYDDDHNSWEPVENIDCVQLIKQYEEAAARKREQSKQPAKVVDKILGATDESGSMCFIVKWKGIAQAEFIESKDANILFPQDVIKFYEERLKWHD